MTFWGWVIVLAGLAAYANPVALFVVWVRRIRGPHQASWRSKLGWISLALASAGFGVVLCFVTCGPEPATMAFDVWFQKCFWVSAVICGVALMTGFGGTGKMQWAVLVSSVISPLSVVLGKALE
jgi:hypothetical protein